MKITVRSYDDVQPFSSAVRDFLHWQPILHNLILTIIDGRLTHPEPGRYWAAFRGGRVVGVALQSPLTYPATIVPMEPDVAAALVDAITDAAIVLPGVNGEAGTAASFAGQWTERNKSGAFPVQGLRLYELIELLSGPSVDGQLRNATTADRDLAVSWLKHFYVETKMPPPNAESLIDTALATGRLWLWQTGSIVSMAMHSQPIEKVVRISGVYTPPEQRSRGYAAACVHGLSSHLTQAGNRCMLYTDLGNPTSNSIYRRIGYKAVAEAIHYRFNQS
jgi:hypothetical protein